MMSIMDDFIPSLAALKYAKEEEIYSFFYLQYMEKDTPTIEIPIYLSPIHYIEEMVCAFAQMYDDEDSDDLNSFITFFLFHRHQKNRIAMERELIREYETKSLEYFDLSEEYRLIDFIVELLHIDNK